MLEVVTGKCEMFALWCKLDFDECMRKAKYCIEFT